MNHQQYNPIKHKRRNWFFFKSTPAIKENQYLDLPLHSDAEEGNEVHDEDRPEHRDVENLEKGTAESNHLE